MNSLKKVFITAIITCSMLGLSASASHALLGIAGTGSLGSFEGSLTYFSSDEFNATLTVTLENTSPALNGGYITAFAFENPDNLISGATLSTTSGVDTQLGGILVDSPFNVSPFGTRDIGAGVGDAWLGNGDPTDGIAVGGGIESFLFTFTGTGLDGLSDESFEEFFIVRFRGFEDGGSDKVLTPEPITMLLFGSGLLGAGLVRRKKRS